MAPLIDESSKDNIVSNFSTIQRPQAIHPDYPKTDFQLEDHAIDDVRPLKVAVVGAGLAGINAGILLPAKVPKIDLTIYEKNEEVSGTWLENIYPGVRCDIASHVYQSTFSPNTQWSEQFAQGAEIREYWKEQARKYNVYQYLKLGHRVHGLEWEDTESVWKVSVTDLQSQSSLEEKFDFVILAIGRFNTWKLPDYPGIHDYKGLLRHTSNWDPSFDPQDKTVAVIGNGASGIQVVPNLQRVAQKVGHYARNPTWIAQAWAGDERTFGSQPFSEEQKNTFKDSDSYLKFRKNLEEKYWRRFRSMIRDSEENKGMRELFTEIMKQRVAKKPELFEGLIPDFAPLCRRLTPGPGYLESLTEDNVEFFKTPIKRFTETGIETVDGQTRDYDAIFCATGAHVDLTPQFPVKSRGYDLSKDWKHDGKFGHPYSYLGMATPGFPNLLLLAGPQAAGGSGTVPHAVETQLAYFAKLLRKVSSQGIKTIVPSKQAADDFVQYCDAFFPTTALTDTCSSWNNGGKPGARIHGLWPGSNAHLTIVRRDPRWEDWEYEYISQSGNRFAYFGHGLTNKELDPNSDLVPYLKKPEEIDLRDLHERWYTYP